MRAGIFMFGAIGMGKALPPPRCSGFERRQKRTGRPSVHARERSGTLGHGCRAPSVLRQGWRVCRADTVVLFSPPYGHGMPVRRAFVPSLHLVKRRAARARKRPFPRRSHARRTFVSGTLRNGARRRRGGAYGQRRLSYTVVWIPVIRQIISAESAKPPSCP